MTRISAVGLRTVIINIIIKGAEIFRRSSWGRHRELHAPSEEGLLLFSVVDMESDPREAAAEAWIGAAKGVGWGARCRGSHLSPAPLVAQKQNEDGIICFKGVRWGDPMNLSSREKGRV